MAAVRAATLARICRAECAAPSRGSGSEEQSASVRAGGGLSRCSTRFRATSLRPVAPTVIVVNGGSSSGKTSIVRELQDMLMEPWLAVSVDDFVNCLPHRLQQDTDGFDVTDDGQVQVGPVFMRLQSAWMTGIAATARAGASIIIDDVFLGAADSQARWRKALSGLPVAWIGVHCDAAVAEQREASRPNRSTGMAALQARQVHRDVAYDVKVDTTRSSARDCAQAIASSLRLE
jgi:chloramphenicol 3-O phosphotransferase